MCQTPDAFNANNQGNHELLFKKHRTIDKKVP